MDNGRYITWWLVIVIAGTVSTSLAFATMWYGLSERVARIEERQQWVRHDIELLQAEVWRKKHAYPVFTHDR